jgi:FixJ family two-component response regulator
MEGIVYIVDDDASVRLALTDLLESVGLRTHAYESGAAFLKALPDGDAATCLVLDIRLPGASGLMFQQELIASNVEIPMIFITGHGDIPMTVQAMKAGAVDFLTKPFRDQELLDAIARALEMDRARRAKEVELNALRHRQQRLTPREREVMELVVQGLQNKQIATSIGASETTVKVHRGQVMKKMEAGTLPDLVRMAEKLAPPVL